MNLRRSAYYAPEQQISELQKMGSILIAAPVISVIRENMADGRFGSNLDGRTKTSSTVSEVRIGRGRLTEPCPPSHLAALALLDDGCGTC
jgi:hypothetical protein